MNTILSNILNMLLNWLSNPATMMAGFAFLLSLPKLIATIKTANGANFYDKALEVAKIQALKALQAGLSDDETVKQVVDAIIHVFPKEAQRYQPILEEIAMIAVHAYVKPNLATETQLNK